MNSKVANFITGVTGIAGTEAVQNAPPLQPEEITSVGNLIIQVILGIATLWGIFRGRKKES